MAEVEVTYWRYDTPRDWRKPPRHPVPWDRWQLKTYLASFEDGDPERLRRVTEPNEHFSYNPRTKAGRALFDELMS